MRVCLQADVFDCAFYILVWKNGSNPQWQKVDLNTPFNPPKKLASKSLAAKPTAIPPIPPKANTPEMLKPSVLKYNKSGSDDKRMLVNSLLIAAGSGGNPHWAVICWSWVRVFSLSDMHA